MDTQHRSTINHLMDMFNGAIEEDIIESILLCRDWNVDQALDDLMNLTSNNAGIEIPLVDEQYSGTTTFINEQPHNGAFYDPSAMIGSDVNVPNTDKLPPPSSEATQHSEGDDSDDDIIVEDKEDYDLETYSDNEDEIAENETVEESKSTVDPPQSSYASIAAKPVTVKAPERRPMPSPMLYAGYTSFDRIKKASDCIERVKLYVQNGFKIMVLLRGCPGSGKSSLAKDLLEKTCPNAVNPYWHIHSTDNYFFLNGKGVYDHDVAKLPEAHQWCHINVLHVAKEGLTPIIIDNTNTEVWHMQTYAKIAVFAGYEIEVLEPPTPWFFTESELVRRNEHGVGKKIIRKCLAHYAHNVTPLSLLRSVELEYATDETPPQAGVRNLTDPKLIATFENIRRKVEAPPPKAIHSGKPTKTKKKKDKKTKLSKKEKKRLKKIEKMMKRLAEDLAAELGSGSEGEEEDRVSVGTCNDTDDQTKDSETNALDSLEDGEELEQIDEDEGNESDADTEDNSDESDCSLKAKDVTIMMPAFVSRNLKRGESSNSTNDESWSTTEDSENESNAEAIGSDKDKADEEYVNGINVNCWEDLLLDEDNKNETTLFDNCEDNSAPLTQSNDDLIDRQETDVVDFTQNATMVMNLIPLEPDRIQVETHDTQNYIGDDLLCNIAKNCPRLKCFEQLREKRPENDISEAVVDKNIFLDEETAKEVVKEKSLSPIGSKKLNNIPRIDESVQDGLHFVNDDSETNRPSPSSEIEAFKRSWNISKTALSQESARSSLGGSSFETAISEDLDFDLNRIKMNALKNADELDLLRSTTPEFERNNEGRCVRSKVWNVESQATNETDLLHTYLNHGICKGNRTSKTVNMDASKMGKLVREGSVDQEAEISNSLIQNVIENKLWSENDEDDGVNESDGSSSSRSSSLDESNKSNRMEDVHNSVNRFVNNDIKKDHVEVGRKRANINLQKGLKNRFAAVAASVASSSSSDSELDTFESATVPELNTLKERILINSLDKVLNQSPLESGEEKRSNLLRNTSASLQLIENNLQELNETQTCLDAWFRGESWDEQTSTQPKDCNEKVVESKPPRVKESPNKNKNADTNTIRLVNDFSLSSGERKNTNQEFDEQQKRAKSSNAGMQQQQQQPNIAEDILKFTPAKFINLFPYEVSTNDPWAVGGELLRRKSKEEPTATPFAETLATSSVFSSKSKEENDRLPDTPTEVDNFFIPAEIMRLGRNKGTMTGTWDCPDSEHVRTTRCREINKGREEREPSLIEARYNCDKSTMTEASMYTVKAKPLREDVANLFPREMIDTILDLYEKCEGNLDWIMEILMDDGHLPTEEQFEYLSSLQNIVRFEQPFEENCQPSPQPPPSSSDIAAVEKKKSKKKRIRKKNEKVKLSLIAPTKEETTIFSEENVQTMENGSEESLLECVDLYLDWELVRQLMTYFGNPTVYPVQDFQPIINVPVSLARQIHAHLIESVIEQAEQNECLINQLVDEDAVVEPCENFTLKDVKDVENSLSDILFNCENSTSADGIGSNVEQSTETIKPTRNEESFASKLSLNLLLKAFPTLDKSFVINTFKSQNYSYYDTKRILNQYKEEIPIPNTSEDSLGVGQSDQLEEDDFQLFDNSSAAMSRNEAIERMKNFREEATANYQQWQKCNEKLKTSVTMKEFGAAAYYREIMKEFKQKYEKCNAQAAAVLVTSCCFQNGEVIDLHFFKVSEALKALDKFLDHHISKLTSNGRQKCILYVITGRGARSAGGISHLQPAVLARLKRRNIDSMVETSNTGLVKAVIRKTSLLSHEL